VIEINVSGLSCPMPVVKAKEAMDKYPEQTIGVVMDSETAKENVSRWHRPKNIPSRLLMNPMTDLHSFSRHLKSNYSR